VEPAPSVSVPSQGRPFPSDAEDLLLSGLRAGDSGAFEQLVRENAGRLLAVARRILCNEEDAQDALQDAFLSAFKAVGAFEGGSKISTWLHRIVVNASLMKLRKASRRNEVSVDDLLPKFQEDGHQADPAVEWRASPSETAESEETRRLVRGAIDQLPDIYRTVLLLRDIEGLDTEETARMLELNINTVKVRLHRARQALRALLDPSFREDG